MSLLLSRRPASRGRKSALLALLVLAAGLQLTGAEGAHAAARDVTVTLAADDNLSGVAMMQIAEDKENPPAPIPFLRVSVVNTAATRLWVRVQDRALNWSNWVSVLVGGAPVIQDPLAKPTYTPVALTPYVPSVDTSTTPPPTSPPSSGGGGGGSGGGFAGAPTLVVTPPPALSESNTVAETATASASLIPAAPKAEVTEPTAPTTPGTSTSSTPAVVSPIAPAPLAPEKPTATPLKTLTTPAKVFTALPVKFGGSATVSSPIAKPLQINLPIGTSAVGLKVSIVTPSGKSIAVVTSKSKTTKQVVVNQVQVLQKGTYTVTVISGTKKSVIKVRIN